MGADDRGWTAVRALADRQFGLFTAAQARALGIAPYTLARWAVADRVIRVHHGVYEDPNSSAWTTFGDWAAQWLALQPSADIDHRRRHPDCVISHSAAAQILRLGTLNAGGLELTAPRRINVRDPRVRTWRRGIGQQGHDWELIDGLPVTTPLRTISDLLGSHGDGGHVGTAVRTALADGAARYADLVAVCDRAAHRWGHTRGEDLLTSLLSASAQPAAVAV
ncbi:MAG: type IV toxin-antitoxin system AbiEi family antitoxin domain-containing protein [Gordonia polyisoprenivorans]|nr:type IV toxin-antitoxin system AbiEi family antitoxin domain-containing protein [Gordonia polyisoprenivorans]